MAIGSLIIKEKFGLSDIETVEMIAENPYMQYFIGIGSFSKKAPMESSLLTWFRKRISPEMLSEINDYIIGRKVIEEKKKDPPDDPPKAGGNTGEDDDKNKGTLILDATCVPSDIRFTTDVLLLNEGRECLEDIIDEQHRLGLTNGDKPRTYRKVARQDYLRFVRNRKPTKKLSEKPPGSSLVTYAVILRRLKPAVQRACHPDQYSGLRWYANCMSNRSRCTRRRAIRLTTVS
jgi:hypothetical protein